MSNHKSLKYLNQRHELVLAREVIYLSDLRDHLILDHSISVQNANTASQLGRLHLLAHAVIAYPELREVFGLPKGRGES